MSDELMVVSNSEVQAFKRCRRKWWLTYYRKLVPIREEVTGVRSIGTRVHGCVAEWYDQQAKGQDPDIESILELHDWAVALDIEAQPEKTEDILKDADMSRAMVEGYMEWLEESGADEGITPIAIEEEVFQVIETPMTKTPVEIRAKLDLRIKYQGPDGEPPQDMFLDHKSVGEFTTPTRVLHLDEQMLLYTWLLQWKEGDDGTNTQGEYERQDAVSSSQSTDAVDLHVLQGTNNSVVGGRGSTTSEDTVRTSRRSQRTERLNQESSSDASRLSLQTSQQGEKETTDNRRTPRESLQGSEEADTRTLQESHNITTGKQTSPSGLVISGAIYNMIRRVKRTRQAKPPFFQRMTINHSPQQLRSFHQRLMGELEDIINIRFMLDNGGDALYYAYPNPTKNCHWDCDFFDVCPLIDRPDDDPDHYLSLIFETGDPYARYKDSGATVE